MQLYSFKVLAIAKTIISYSIWYEVYMYVHFETSVFTDFLNFLKLLSLIIATVMLYSV